MQEHVKVLKMAASLAAEHAAPGFVTVNQLHAATRAVERLSQQFFQQASSAAAPGHFKHTTAKLIRCCLLAWRLKAGS
eukprot:4362504-Lingulodinium_polyedra.AAC.1